MNKNNNSRRTPSSANGKRRKKRNAEVGRFRDSDSEKDKRSPSSSRSYVADTEKNNTFGSNAIEWYSRFPNLLLSAGSIPYPYKPGMEIPWGVFKTQGAQTDPAVVSTTIPGVFSIHWWPSIGISEGPTSPASILGKEMYAKVREKFSGALDADAPDFVIYMLALDSIFSYIASLKRVYRILNAYSPENYVIPDGLLVALGYNNAQIQALRQHKMEFFQRINELVLMTRKFKCPRILDLFNRHVWLNDHVYTDAPTIKSQFYVFRQHGWYKFSMQPVPNVTPTVQAGAVTIVQPTLGGTSVVQDLYEFGRGLIDALASSDDGYLISGYLMRAYEGYPDFVVDELLLSEEIVPKYNEEVLSEIENAHTIPSGHTALSTNVYQDPSTNSIISHPTVHYAPNSSAINLRFDGVYPRFNARSDNPTVAESTIQSRMMSYILNMTVDSEGYGTANILCCTELYGQFQLVTPYATSTGIQYTTDTIGSEFYTNMAHGSAISVVHELDSILQLSQWDWMPIILVILQDNNAQIVNVVGDIHNVTTVSLETLKNLNTVCLYSLFGSFSE